MGIKEGTCDEHQMLYGSSESLYCTPETNTILYFNSLELKKKKTFKKPAGNPVYKLGNHRENLNLVGRETSV